MAITEHRPRQYISFCAPLWFGHLWLVYCHCSKPLKVRYSQGCIWLIPTTINTNINESLIILSPNIAYMLGQTPTGFPCWQRRQPPDKRNFMTGYHFPLNSNFCKQRKHIWITCSVLHLQTTCNGFTAFVSKRRDLQITTAIISDYIQAYTWSVNFSLSHDFVILP